MIIRERYELRVNTDSDRNGICLSVGNTKYCNKITIYIDCYLNNNYIKLLQYMTGNDYV